MSEESELIQARKDKLIGFVKAKANAIFLIILAGLLWMAWKLRTLNLPGLKDVTTGGWTLGPDLDPFLFLRYAKSIVANGSLMAVDMMRNVPLGFNTAEETQLLPYMMAYFHKFLAFFSSKTTVEYSAVIFPAFMFLLTVIAFFLLVKKIFQNYGRNISWAISLIASAFLIVMPSLLNRTIAGIPEKESVGFMFLFLSLYLFVCAWQAGTLRKSILLALLAGISTAAMGLIWGGFVFIIMTIAIACFVAFCLGQFGKREKYVYFAWIISASAVLLLLTEKYSLMNLVGSTSTGMAFAVAGLLVIDSISRIRKIDDYISSKFGKIPRAGIIIGATIIAGIILASIMMGPGFIIGEGKDIIGHLIHPFSEDRFSITVAENRQPYFNEWANTFGPVVNGIPVMFWLFFAGSIVLFYGILKSLRQKERTGMTIAYGLFLFALVFSRNSSSSTLNGENFISILLYMGGFIVLAVAAIWVYRNYFNEGNIDKFKEIPFAELMLFVLFVLSIISARGAVRLIMVLVPSAAIMASYLAVISIVSAKKRSTDDLKRTLKWAAAIFIILVMLFAFAKHYQTTKAEAAVFIPSMYTQQWQKAMGWVRNSTPENAVFSHWWDYGYWLQTIGERATVLDGGNAIVYWNHLFGRHVLTGLSEREALDFLYTHNATHLLIDSSDIGKYTAYSSIGSAKELDRYSWINPFVLNEKSTQESRNKTSYVYQGQFVLDEDYIMNFEGKQLLYPRGGSAVIGVIINIDENRSFLQPEIVIATSNKQAKVGLRYLYANGTLMDFKEGYQGGVRIIPSVSQNSQGVSSNPVGALIFLSNRTISGLMAKLFILNQGEAFKLAHEEPNPIIQNLEEQGMKLEEFAYFNGDILGPIKIWEIDYPKDMKYLPEYMELNYPDPSFRYGEE